MITKVSIEIDEASYRKVLGKLTLADFAASEYFIKAMMESAEAVESVVVLGTPVDTDYLRGSIDSGILSVRGKEIEGIITTGDVIYAPPVESGVRGRTYTYNIRGMKIRGVGAKMFTKGLKKGEKIVAAIFKKYAEKFVEAMGR